MASITVPCPKVASFVRVGSNGQVKTQQNQLAFGSSRRQSALSLSRGPRRKGAAALKVLASSNEVSVQESSNSVPLVDASANDVSPKAIDEPAEQTIPEPSAISEFMAQVSDLIKLVDSRDIVELQLKQLDSEIIIRKKEALQPVAPPPPPPPQYYAMPQQMPQAMYQPQAPAAPAPTPASTPSSAPLALPAPAAAKSSHPPLKSPMAGTFYRCPGPGEPPFVKVGDAVQKGQVLCIIEAMKLMNEIEADKSGTISAILLDDGKPVSAGTPLFVIA